MSRDATLFDHIIEVLAERFALLDESTINEGIDVDGNELVTELLSGRN